MKINNCNKLIIKYLLNRLMKLAKNCLSLKKLIFWFKKIRSQKKKFKIGKVSIEVYRNKFNIRIPYNMS